MKDTYATVIVDLMSSEEEILKKIEKSARNGVTKAQRSGLRVEEAGLSAKEYSMYQQTMIDGGSEPETIEELKKEMIVMFVCLKEDKIIAEASLKIEDGRITLHTNSSLKEYQHLQPNNLLYWECIKWAKAQGYKELDLGGFQDGIMSKHLKGINDFKKKWGQIRYYEKDYPFFRALGRKLIKKNKMLWEINRVIRGRK